MPCIPFKTPDGATGIMCIRGRTRRCECGKPADRLCDWKVKARKSGTCDRPICPSCSVSPAPDKDLCKEHGAAWSRHGRNPGFDPVATQADLFTGDADG